MNYKKERIFDKFGLQAGFSLIHYSNANVKAPNNGTNSITYNVGVTYSLDDEDLEYQYTIDKKQDQVFSEPIKYNIAFRAGINESDIVGSRAICDVCLSAYADKRINKKVLSIRNRCVFLKLFKRIIYYQSVAFPNRVSLEMKTINVLVFLLGMNCFLIKHR